MVRPNLRSNNNNDEVKVMQGQTDEERRHLREGYRALSKKIASKGEEMEDLRNDIFDQVREENNGLFKEVRFTREAVLDGDNLEAISSRAARQVDRLVQVPRYDPINFTEKLRTKCCKPNGQFDWLALGIQAGSCFNKTMAQVAFLGGPLEADYTPKERKKSTRRTTQDEEVEAEEEQPEDVKEQAKNGDQLSAVERNILVLRRVLRKKCHETQKRQLEELNAMPEEEQEPARKRLNDTQGEIDIVQYLFDPKSFTQTIENIFHFSFMVKDGEARMTTRKDGDEPGVKVKVIAGGGAHGDEPKGPTKQTITSLNMRDWKRLCQAYNVTKGDIPHRTGSKHMKQEASQVFE